MWLEDDGWHWDYTIKTSPPKSVPDTTLHYTVYGTAETEEKALRQIEEQRVKLRDRAI